MLHDNDKTDPAANGDTTAAAERITSDRPAPRHDEHAMPIDLQPISGRGMAVIGLTLALLLGSLFVLGWVPHQRRLAQADTDAATAVSAKPVVDIITPKVADKVIDLNLPADVRAYQATAVYARSSGYLKPLPAGIDIGARVKAGQLMAEIAAPEVDADLDQARATLEQTKVSVVHATEDMEFNKATFERYQGFAATGGLTTQQLDERRQQYNTSSTALREAEASRAAAAAAVKRLEELKGYQQITAPYDGVITSRKYDAGALISISSNGPGQEMFQIAQTSTLRVFVNVPQSSATDIVTGREASLSVSNFPAELFTGTVARTAESIDPATRTLRVEIDVPNEGGRLLPGMYGQVRFHLVREHPSVVVPTGALVFSSEGMRVATAENGRIKFHPVTLGRDFGTEAEVVAGLAADAQVVMNPGEGLQDGTEVTPRAPQPAKPGQTPSQGQTQSQEPRR